MTSQSTSRTQSAVFGLHVRIGEAGNNLWSYNELTNDIVEGAYEGNWGHRQAAKRKYLLCHPTYAVDPVAHIGRAAAQVTYEAVATSVFAQSSQARVIIAPS